MRRILIILLTTIICSLGAVAQSMKTYTNKVKNGYNFWLYKPKCADRPDDKIPLVIFLHGSSLKGTNLNKVKRYGTLDAINKGLDIEAYVLAPQTSTAWSPVKIKNTMDYVLEHNDNIDRNRIYVIGMSLGGYGTIDFAATYADEIAAAMAICGGGSVKDQTSLNDMPLWIVHGTGDRAVSVKESDKVVAQIKKADSETPRLIYTRVPGMNHSQPARLLYMPKVYQWLFEHSLEDESRPVAPGFHIDNQSIKGAYNQIKSEKVSLSKDKNPQ